MTFAIFLALLAPVFFAVTNVIDSYLSNRTTFNIWAIIFYASVFDVLFLPIVVLIQMPTLPPLHTVPVLMLIALLEILYAVPYYKALRYDDASTVSDLFELGRLFVPLFAFLFIGEHLHSSQYIGAAVIILSSVCLSWKPSSRLHLDKAFWYMLLASGLVSLQVVLYKYVFIEDTWSNGFFWPTVCLFFLSLIMLCIRPWRKDIVTHLPTLKSMAPLFFLLQLCFFAGSLISTYSVSLLPVTVSTALGSIQPLFVMIIAIILFHFWPHLIKEHDNRQAVLKKTALFILMGIGVWLVV